MHKFLRSIGFSDIRKKDMEIVLRGIIECPEVMKVTRDSEGNEFAELSKSFAPNVGITVRGNYREDDSFEVDYYYPYVSGTSVSTQEQIEVEKHAEKESYAGVCDELHLGVTLIFYLQNVADYLAERNTHSSWGNYGAMLAGLSVDGRILLPIQENARREKANVSGGSSRSQLMAEARDGNEEAIESLTIEDMDTYALISQRIVNEDILSIVKSTFMPYGIESDQYSVLGEILEFSYMENSMTHEKMYGLKVLCNDIIFDVCINEKDLLGEPAVGRRFKGSVWLQGSLCME
ncbi:MAG: DUF3881 family protein [Muribaculaceae bacterium]|nr:DUF3881 family protein [Roseburia sp.]MCM1432200.1 DUF3881 family protein [Muribaculaceae bacterium]MCM1493933.1 DUF3881 family protein [Muribaculaceae bacterium]